jgi:hypothetical protein
MEAIDMAKNSQIRLGGFALIDGYSDKKNPTTDITQLEIAVAQAIWLYQSHFPGDERYLVQMHEETAERFGVNGTVAGLKIRRDRDIPQGYVWVGRDDYEGTM